MSFFTENARKIRKNATWILAEKKIEASLSKTGKLYYTGSYALDLMTWNDIDMQIVFQDQCPIDVLGDFFKTISQDPDFIEAQIIHFTGSYKPKMPRGVYLGLKLFCPHHGGLWKIDLWSLAKADFEKNRRLIEKLQSKLTSELREFILEMKMAMMAGGERMPQMSSHLLYQAILLEGIVDRTSLREYFIKHNLSLRW